MSWLMVTHYNSCWKPHTLRIPIGDQRYRYRTPAMAVGLTDHAWSVMELLSYQLLETG
ncbi:MAG: hypothetical protein HQL73_08185 [Magnetococcales bacterium]|nr:hypothetical protein [Magnetococcales bacterium]